MEGFRRRSYWPPLCAAARTRCLQPTPLSVQTGQLTRVSVLPFRMHRQDAIELGARAGIGHHNIALGLQQPLRRVDSERVAVDVCCPNDDDQLAGYPVAPGCADERTTRLRIWH